MFNLSLLEKKIHGDESVVPRPACSWNMLDIVRNCGGGTGISLAKDVMLANV